MNLPGKARRDSVAERIARRYDPDRLRPQAGEGWS